jgi:4-hydroxy-tetrahydrodipicolinate synthase
MIFTGSIPAVITPFNKNLEIDFDCLHKHIDFLITEGSHGLVSCGTTGESPTLNHDEHKKVTEFIIKKTNSRVPVMAGCGSNSTKETLDLVRHAKMSGANATLLVTPYYNKPSDNGLYEHFKKIATQSSRFPIYLYNIPGRSVIKISSELMKKLSKISNIVGVKDATSDLTMPMEVRHNCGGKFHQLSGEDATFLAFLINGGMGCISVTANVTPRICAEIYNNWKKKNFDEAMRLNFLLYPLNKALFLETSPCPVKYALSKLKRCKNIMRLPLTSINQETKNEIDKVLNNLNLRK